MCKYMWPAALSLLVACGPVDPGDTGGAGGAGGGTSAPACSPSNCAGCCNGNRCETGTTSSACGAAGAACTSCAGDQTCGAGACVAPTVRTPIPMRVFITRQSYKGNLKDLGNAATGLQGADNLCQLAADSVNLGGTFKAWLSDSTTRAVDRIAGEGPWVNLKGEKVFNNRSTLVLGPLLPIRWDERLGDTTAGGVTFADVWTGTSASGQVFQSASYGTADCQSWTSSSYSDYGSNGRSDATSKQWTENNAANCSYDKRLYCFEQ